MTLAASFLARHWERLSLGRYGPREKLSCLLVTPRFRTSAHVIFLVFSASSPDPVLVLKVTRDKARAGGRLQREARNLVELEKAHPAADGSIPRLLTQESAAGHLVLLETGVAGRTMRPSVVRRHPVASAEALLRWILRFHASTEVPPGDRGPDVARLVEAPLERLEDVAGSDVIPADLVSRTRELLSPLRAVPFPLVFEHGDLGSPNLLVDSERRVGVVDWELAEPRGLPGHDLFFSFAYLAFARRRARSKREHVAAFDEAFFGKRAWAAPYVAHYARALALPREVVPALFVACWARYVAGIEARLAYLEGDRSFHEGDSSRQGASPRAPAASRLADSRYLALWRHAVDRAGELALGFAPARPEANPRRTHPAGGG